MAKATGRTKRGNGSAPAVERVSAPDVLGDRGRARMAARLLRKHQADLAELDLVQASNQHGDDEPVPGLPPQPDGSPWTYGARREFFRELERRVCEAFPDLLPLIEEQLDALQAEAAATGQ